MRECAGPNTICYGERNRRHRERRVAASEHPWNVRFSSRNPDLSDGSTATERLTEYTVGQSFAYELTGFTNVLRRLIHGVRGEWTFTPTATAQ